MLDIKKFGQALRKLRKGKNLTLLQLSLELSIDDAYLSEIERGNKIPSIELAITIANYFNISFSEILNENDMTINNLQKEINTKITSIDSIDCIYLKKLLNKVILQKGDTYV